MPALHLQPVLVGPSITLRPLQASDFERLYAAASDPLIWAQHPDSQRYQRDIFEARFFTPGLQSGTTLVVVENATQQLVGSSRYYDVDEAKRELAIGYTFLARTYWGGQTNREMKTLMLDHAFTWATQVWFHIGSSNLRSRKAVEKIGAEFSHEVVRQVNGEAQPTAFYKLARAA